MNADSIKQIVIFIVSFNRLDCLKKLIGRLENDGYKNIVILDNASTYKPLLEYLSSLPYKVHFFDKNYGHEVLWKCGLFKDVIEANYYVLTDPDVLPIDECPSDFLQLFFDTLQTYPEYTKVGFSLKIDDLPDYFINKYDFIRWETFFYEKKISSNPLLYDADIDTTFALYKPGYPKNFFKGIRTGFPYTAHHLGWYVDINNPTDEDRFYLSTSNSSASSFNNPAIEELKKGTLAKLTDKIEKINLFNFNRSILRLERFKDISFIDIWKTAAFLTVKKFYFYYRDLSKRK